MAGKMFAAIGHTALQQAMHQALGQQGHYARVPGEGAVADDGAAGSAGLPRASQTRPRGRMRAAICGDFMLVIQVEHRREAQVHPTGAQLGTQYIAPRGGGIGSVQGAGVLFRRGGGHPHLAQCAHGRQVGKSVRLEPLHAAALMVHADQQPGPDLLDVTAQGCQLGTVLPVACKQDQPADQRMLQAPAVCLAQRGAGNVDDEGRVEGHGRHP